MPTIKFPAMAQVNILCIQSIPIVRQGQCECNLVRKVTEHLIGGSQQVHACCRYIAYLENRLLEQQSSLDIALDTPQADVIPTTTASG